MTRLPWRPGAAVSWRGPFYISATRFTYQRIWHTLPVSLHGLRLRNGWPEIEGTIGLSLMSDTAARTTYTLSVWQSVNDLHRWVRSPGHTRLMRGYRPWLESSAASSWSVETFDLRTAWREAMLRLGSQTKPAASGARRS
jgi:hypothetical protein